MTDLETQVEALMQTLPRLWRCERCGTATDTANYTVDCSHGMGDIEDYSRTAEVRALLTSLVQEKADILMKDRIKTGEINLLVNEVKGLEARLTAVGEEGDWLIQRRQR